VGLGHLIPALDREERWDKELSLQQQQHLVLARMLLHRPRAVFFDEAMGTLDGERHRLILSIFEGELADTTVVSTGGGPAHHGFYNRTVRLVRLSGGVGVSLRARPRLVAVQTRAPAAAGFAEARAPVRAVAR
jgi:putative ATP-binding cassette transporter